MSRPRILLVHDRGPEAQRVRLLLGLLEYECCWAPSADDALALLEHVTPSAALVHVGNGDGPALRPLRRVAAALAAVDVPVVALGGELSLAATGALRAIGCRAVLERPLAPATLGAVLSHLRQARPSTAPRRDEPLGPRTVLVVDDEPALREMLQRVLERSGHSVLAARDGRGALEHAKANAGRIDLLVVDVGLPDVDGRSLALQLRARDRWLPVIVTSGHIEDDEIEALRGPGVRVLRKPFALDAFDRVVDELLASAPTIG